MILKPELIPAARLRPTFSEGDARWGRLWKRGIASRRTEMSRSCKWLWPGVDQCGARSGSKSAVWW